jgi:hypothetical protein
VCGLVRVPKISDALALGNVAKFGRLRYEIHGGPSVVPFPVGILPSPRNLSDLPCKADRKRKSLDLLRAFVCTCDAVHGIA